MYKTSNQQNKLVSIPFAPSRNVLKNKNKNKLLKETKSYTPTNVKHIIVLPYLHQHRFQTRLNQTKHIKLEVEASVSYVRHIHLA